MCVCECVDECIVRCARTLAGARAKLCVPSLHTHMHTLRHEHTWISSHALRGCNEQLLITATN